ncbi:hypothetical protein E1285_16575 [Actinomadura sp. 7K507]|nr:hypothetical protein E1285_16575 [Actinomadura sp. 7K507]
MGARPLKVTCGIDWAERHHDVALVDSHGKLVARRRINDGVPGCQALVDLPTSCASTPPITGHCRRTPNSCSPSRCWPALAGRGLEPPAAGPTSSVHHSATSSRPRSRPSGSEVGLTSAEARGVLTAAPTPTT